MTLSEMKKQKKELGLTNEMISRLSGVPLGTVQKIFAGITDSPRYDTLDALGKVFDDFNTPPDLVREASGTYGSKQQGEYTLDDYYALPDDLRVELIDGVFFEMNSPTTIHQLIGSLLWKELWDYIEDKKGECLTFVAPVDVQLDRDDRTILQPDVLIVCDRDKIIRRCVYGAPDFIVEVLSPSTRRKDSYLKLQKYANAGVSEYWLIDPDRKKILVYDLAHEEPPVIYGFDSTIPIALFNGECRIDFQRIHERIKFLYDAEE